ncbi:DUF5131 family protein [Chelatococcus asaccharovorans]|uniref:Protein gp37 n=1 Tax=Chelatococcus asaccharovorans TaxID=28210 RepID=A0A2V3U535_9HYPH|nr:phage Gp37/Gp68 family protein [Chelatococcus asaccharovorans]PXW57006.1 protein gp37 [Chelatococcus asaccharovorans]
MGDRTGIQWTDASWNPIVGCSIVSPGCTNCYAMKMAARIESIDAAAAMGRYNQAAAGFLDYGTEQQRADALQLLEPRTHYAGTTTRVKDKTVWTGKMALAPDTILTQPLRWKRPRRVFVNSMGDLFHESVPDEWIDRVFAVMALAPQHSFQVLTKRSARMRDYVNGKKFSVPILGAMPLERVHLEAAAHFEGDGGFWDEIKKAGNVYSLYCSVPWPLPNVWLGVSAEDQRRWDERIPDLKETPAAERFVSAEPLLGPIVGDMAGLDWIIVGGESGPGSRPMHPDWARSIRDQCAAAGVPFFFKQWGDWCDERQATAQGCAPGADMFGADGMPRGDRWHFYDGDDVIGGAAIRIGKRAAGRLLDGIEHNAMPERAHG